MAISLEKPWISSDRLNEVLAGHMGVFQLANDSDQTIFIGFAGGKSPGGLRLEVAKNLAAFPDAESFRYEITTSYWSRFKELMSLHWAEHKSYPKLNERTQVGRISPTAAGAD